MKKIYYAVLLLLALGVVGFFHQTVNAAKNTDTCNYVTTKNIPYSAGHYLFGENLMPGYDVFGYNYQAHMFNGFFANAYLGRPGTAYAPYMGDDDAYLVKYPNAVNHWTWPYRMIQLQMKWNDAWLANKDCDKNGELDRHAGFGSYIGSGAWLTNHAKGTYESIEKYNWDVAGDWVIAVNNGAYLHDYSFVMTSLPDGSFTGTGGYPSGAVDYTFDEVVINGQVTGNTVAFTASYYINGVPTGYSWNATGTIDGTGHFVNGTGTSGVTEWHSTSGQAKKVYMTCEVSDFVKIVAAPSTAFKDDLATGGYGEGMWYTDNTKTTEIGPVLWGDFAVIQEISDDPCGEYGVIDYLSQVKKGLGNWSY